MKNILFSVLVILGIAAAITQLNSVNAGIYGYVNITILASPPSIASIMITPQEAYSDSILNCEIELRGNNLSDATLAYKWYVNDEFRGSEKQLQGLNIGDQVVCKVDVYDSLGRGETKSASTLIRARNSGITGYIVNNLGDIAKTNKTGLITIISLISIALIISRRR